MKLVMKILLGLGIILIIVASIGMLTTKENFASLHAYENTGSVIEIAVLEQKVNDYLSSYREPLSISDIFVFEDSDYYFSIIEANTGKGAMELLVNPYTGDIYPEFGPNMMWNLKYGMMGGHMTSGRGMMGIQYRNTDIAYENSVSIEKAMSYANEYLQSNFTDTFSVADDVHDFYGYYTFHVMKENVTTGMMSVNGISGEVWYHDWHGKLIEVTEHD